ncbi:mechanosensitive ion channel family protein [Striga asiatica]|uniref:Mechanosensitive ion channel protein n=1 Tax=Striga asiatica TaxID=4170 RepID=A0A5A7RIE5_STRAF|nr:mechanosensitive ion channel family protein [Striga asiatica]
MESEISLKEEVENHDVIVEINSQENPGISSRLEENMADISRAQINLFLTNPAPIVVPTQTPPPPSPIQTIAPPPDASSKPPVRRRMLATSAYSKPKSRIAEPHFSTKKGPEQQNVPSKSPVMTSPNPNPNSTPKNATPKTSAPITPRTPLMESMDGDDDDDNDEDVYKTENLKVGQPKKGKKVNIMIVAEWVLFVSITTVLILSRTVNKLKDTEVWSLGLWKWCVLVLVIFCGRLFTEWLINTLVFLIEKNFLLKKKVLYFVFGLKKSVRVVIWLALILLAWALIINRGVRRTESTSRVLNYITRGIVSTLVGAVMWMAKTLFVKIVASSFHVRTYFDRIQESIFHQYILQALSGAPPAVEEKDGSRLSGTLSFIRKGNNGEVINVDKLYKMRREKVSAWTMGGLIKVIRNSELPTVSEVLDESVEEEEGFGGPKVITSEVEAREAADRIFKNVAKPGHRYIEEDDLLLFMPKEEVDSAFPLFEGATESRRIKRSSFRIWVVKAYNERKCLAVSLKDAKTAIEELNKIASGIILIVIIIVWLLLMEITTTTVLVFISSQLLLAVFIFGNTVKSVFEAIIFVFIVHPFDVGDRCVIDGVQMIVDEMNILTTIFLKADNEKVYYPNSVLATKAISNFNRSPEMMGDTVEFAVDFNTSVENIASLKAKIKGYLESKPQHWSPSHSVQVKEIVDVNKMLMALYVTHTINFQNSGERGERRSALVFELKKIFVELDITYRLLPQEVQISYVDRGISVTGAGERL